MITTYVFKPNERFIGLTSWFANVYEASTLEPVEKTAYFAAVTVKMECWCPVEPKGLTIQSDSFNAEGKRVFTISWDSWSTHKQGGNPLKYTLGSKKMLDKEVVDTLEIQNSQSQVQITTSFSQFDSVSFILTAVGDGCSATTSVQKLDDTRPPGPPILAFRARLDCDSAELTFIAPSDNGGTPITHYNLYQRLSPRDGDFSLLREVKPTETVLTVTGLTQKAMEFRLVAFTVFGESVPSNVVLVNTAEKPGPPRNHKISYTSGDVIKLTWEPPEPLCTEIIRYTISGKGGSQNSEQKLPCVFENANELLLECTLSLSSLRKEGTLQPCDTLFSEVIAETSLGPTGPSNEAS